MNDKVFKPISCDECRAHRDVDLYKVENNVYLCQNCLNDFTERCEVCGEMFRIRNRRVMCNECDALYKKRVNIARRRNNFKII
jgi:hypothetical protein